MTSPIREQRLAPLDRSQAKAFELRLPDVSEGLAPVSILAQRAVSLVIGTVITVVLLVVGASMFVEMDVMIDAAGSIQPLTVWPVRVRAAGTVANVFVRSGDTVHAGQLLAQLDSSATTADLRSRRMQLAESATDFERARAVAPLNYAQQADKIADAEAALLRAKAMLRQRLMEFSLHGNVDSVLKAYVPGRSVNVDLALADVHAAETGVRAAMLARDQAALDSVDLRRRQVEMDRMRADISNAEHEQGKLRIVAPANGLVLTEQLDRLRGAYVPSGSELLEIADTRHWTAELLVRERDIHDVHVGQRATIEVPALKALDGRQLIGTVMSVAQQPTVATDAQDALPLPGASRSYRVVVGIDPREFKSVGASGLRRGYAVRGGIVTHSGNVLFLIVNYVRDWIAERRMS